MVSKGDDTASSISPKAPCLEIIPHTSLHIGQKLGQGGFGTVYRAVHTQWGNVAVKKLTTNFIEQRVERKLVAEAQKLHSLSHPNTIQMLGLVMQDNHYAIVLEFMPHGSLDVFIETYTVSWPMKLELIEGVVLAMNYLHTRSSAIVHRDLKAPNVLVGRDFNVKVAPAIFYSRRINCPYEGKLPRWNMDHPSTVPRVADFGLSKWRAFSQSCTNHATKGVGTVTHMPPEIWANLSLRPEPSYDMYSFAILVWEVCVQEPPFYGLDLGLVKDGVKEGQRPDLDRVKEVGAPDVLITIMQDGWHQDPNYRPSFNIVKEALERDTTRANVDIERERLDLMKQATPSSPVEEVGESVPNPVLGDLASDLGAVHIGYPVSEQNSLPPTPHSVGRPLERQVRPAYPASTDDAHRKPCDVKNQTNGLNVRGSPNDPYPGGNADRVLMRRVQPVYPASGQLTDQSENAARGPAQPLHDNQEPDIDGIESEPPTPEPKCAEDGASLRPGPRTSLQIAQCPGDPSQPQSVSSQPDNCQRLLRQKLGNRQARPGTSDIMAQGSTTSRDSTTSRGSTLPREAEPDAEPESMNSASLPQERLPSTAESFPRAAVNKRVDGPAPRTALRAPPQASSNSAPPPHPPQKNLPGYLKDFLPNLAVELPDFSKNSSSSFVMHQRDGMGTTIIYNSDKTAGKSNSIQIGDHNVMHIHSGPRAATAPAPAMPRPQQQARIVPTIPRDRITRSNKLLDMANMEVVSKHLGKYWKALGRRLGFSAGELDQINADYHVDGLQEKIHQMLERWRVKEGKDATVGALADKLWGIDRYSIAAMLK